ncbi:MAG: chemotaxis response regulator protein-glutamate methylesterase [Melioribacteraceae bacterium]|nr:chemotaxis response regulator protein-glutamate methylesterase [Melioribacteraceae bacterium]MCF8354007.1 chemotaxis response regulator protein-glutamate methylesterase [Melioribacteraceae bacterium]MCF8392312.1 chemotaxis response regulator protein-glutamate methylesterase [Melioribacteraceae bacterium]MCF8417644.1 chemotaxis response regulator protein-glutamate methylesterase [Melioribacteraceae bacterium]
MRIAIVNDLKIAVETLKRVVLSIPGYEVAWVAWDGQEAIDKIQDDKPDLVLMDLIMPVMDGVESTRRIMQTCSVPILVVTASVRGNSPKVFAAMGYGALDAVKTPKLGINGSLEGAEVLVEKIKVISRLIGKRADGFDTTVESFQREIAKTDLPTLVVIGSSTGGPKALSEILTEIPANFRSPIVIIQHVDESFANGLAEWLNHYSKLTVKIAKNGQSPRPGTVFIAGTNDHLILKPNLTFEYTHEPASYPYRPSVDVFFNSVAENWYGKVVAVILTGMGKDGAKGMLSIKKSGMTTIAQDKDTSIVYGMPKAAFEAGAVDKVLPLNKIAEQIIKSV